jgi:hypothetical protein
MEEEQKKSNTWVWITAVIIALAMLVPALRLLKKANTTDVNLAKEDISAFNSDSGQVPAKGQAPESAPSLYDGGLNVRYVTKAQQSSSQQARVRQRAAEQQAYASQTAASARRAANTIAGTSQREFDFLRRNDRMLKQYQAYLTSIGSKYRDRFPAVRQMDAEFAGRYMALRRQYAADRDAYKWARSTMALPEVRDAILRYSKNPQVLRAMVEVSLEALAHPPPQAVYKEIMGFLCSDAQGSSFVKDLSGPVMSNVTKNISKAIPRGTDLTSLQDLAQEMQAQQTSSFSNR